MVPTVRILGEELADLNAVKNRVQGFLAANVTAELTENGGFSLRHGSAKMFIDFKQYEYR